MTEMSDQQPESRPSTGAAAAQPGSEHGEIMSLETDRGTTSIDESVVAKIAGMAAREVDGVADLGGTISGALSGIVGRIRGEEHQTTGVGVEVGTREAAVDLTVQVHYPAAINEVADSVRDSVIDRIESMTGLDVVEVNIAVTDLVFPGGEKRDGGPRRVE